MSFDCSCGLARKSMRGPPQNMAKRRAMRGGHLDAIKSFLDMGVNVHGVSTSEHGQAVFHLRHGGEPVHVVKLLLDLGPM